MISQIVTGVLFANGLTLTMLYAVWRLKKNEGDLKAIGLFLICCLFAGVMAWPVDQPEAPPEALHSSAAPIASRQ